MLSQSSAPASLATQARMTIAELAIEGRAGDLHPLDVRRLRHSPRYLLRGDILDVGLDPPDIAEGIADAAAAIPPGHGPERRHFGRSRCLRAPVHGVAILDVERQKGRSV